MFVLENTESYFVVDEADLMQSKRILVIDDEMVMQEVVRGCLEDLAGWEVFVASSGQEGIEQAIVHHPDAIVLDVMMPGMDGLTVLKHLNADPTIQSIPVVLLTAKVELTDPRGFRKLGVAGAIAKPFDPMELVLQIADFLDWTAES